MAEQNTPRQHISGQFNQELETVTARMLEMGGLVEKHVAAALSALLELDSGEAQGVMDMDRAINALEVDIDDECFRILARRDARAALTLARGDEEIDTNVAGAMRALKDAMREEPDNVEACITAMWALRSFERIGENARNIPEYVIYLVEGVDVRHAEREAVLGLLPERPRSE